MAKISVGIPLYNGERHLAPTLDSLLAQSFQDFEIVISDNASTDSSQAIVRDYAARDKRIRYYRNNTNVGAAANFNRVFQLSSAPYFRWNAHDDIVKPTYLERCVTVLDMQPDVVLCHTRSTLIDDNGADLVYDTERGRYTDKSGVISIEGPDPVIAQAEDPVTRFYDVYRHVIRCIPIFGLMRRDVLCRVGLFWSYYSSDKGILLGMSLYGRFYEISETLFLKREHRSNSVNLASDKAKALWQDPSRRPPHRFPHRDKYLHASALILWSPLSPGQKVRCLTMIVRAVPWYKLWRFERRPLSRNTLE